jgi:hypothetical protein
MTFKEKWKKYWANDPRNNRRTFSVGCKVNYMGVEWIVTDDFYMDVFNEHLTLERINPTGEYESVSLPNRKRTLVSYSP